MVASEYTQLTSISRTAIYVVALSIPLVFLAFWPLYLSKPLGGSDVYTHLHAITGTLWLVVLLVQPIAIKLHRYSLHKAVGRISYLLAPLFFIAGILLSHHRPKSMDEVTFASEGYSHFLPFYASVVFGTAYCFGLIYRSLPLAHARFMLLTAIPLIDPVLGRILFFYLPSLPHPMLYQGVGFLVGTVIAAILVFSYIGERSAKRALLAYFVLLLLLEIGWFTIARTGAWLYLVSLFRSVPLT